MATLDQSSIQSSFGVFGIDNYFCLFLFSDKILNGKPDDQYSQISLHILSYRST
uniref:Uncharacterized protein n=1 Tax=Medicago truncatula TaxID=3880 RepID=Q2HS75_MEDTR|nr:hypothetical protein MtrDRAFT_AC155883g20v2 [Medicago truncatula]